MTYRDILYEATDGVATITINRPEAYNAFRSATCEELLDAFQRAAWDDSVGVIVLAGAGNKSFCTGGDQSAHEGQYDGRGTIGLPLEQLQAFKLFYGTEESQEGVRAFKEKRKPDFRRGPS